MVLDAVYLVSLLLDQSRHVDEHVVHLFDAFLQLHDVLVTRFDVCQRLSRLLRVHLDLSDSEGQGSGARDARSSRTDPLREDSWVSLFQHLLHFIVSRRASSFKCHESGQECLRREASLTDLELTLDPLLALLAIVVLHVVVVRHDLNQRVFQRRLLRLLDPVLCASLVLHLLDFGVHRLQSVAHFGRSSLDLEHEILEPDFGLLVRSRSREDLRVKLLHFIDARRHVLDRSIDFINLTVEEAEGVVGDSEGDGELFIPVLLLDLRV